MRSPACCRCARAPPSRSTPTSGYLRFSRSNSIFNVLNEKNVKRQAIEVRQGVRAGPARRFAFGHRDPAVRGSRQGRLVSRRQGASGGSEGAGDTLGLRIPDKTSGKYFYFLAACARVTDDLKSRLGGRSLVFFDGTVWRDDELIAAGLGNKTGQGMGHISMSGDQGAIESLKASISGLRCFCISTTPTLPCCTARPSAKP